MNKLTRQELHWRTDMQDTAAGDLGPWWQARLHRFHADGGAGWRNWRTIRMTEWHPATATGLDGSPLQVTAHTERQEPELLAG